MIAFAGNSLLCRAALKHSGIDAATFTFIRIFSGAAALWLIIKVRRRLMVDRTASPLVETSSDFSLVTDHSSLRQSGNWLSALALFVYAAAFSSAYNTLSAGTGALLLFGAVQATMILWGLHKGERLRGLQLLGLAVALSGLVVLLFPGLSAPPFPGCALMLAAGVAWGAYSLRGREEANPASATAGNFRRAVPMALALSIVLFPIGAPRPRRNYLCRALRRDRFGLRLRDLVYRTAGFGGSQRRDRAVECAGPGGHRRDPLARRTAHLAFRLRVQRSPGRHRAGRLGTASGRVNPRLDWRSVRRC